MTIEVPLTASAEELRLCTVTTKQGMGCGLFCPEIQGDVWVDAAVAPPWQLDVHDTVACRIQGSTPGGLRALAPVWKRMGSSNTEGEAPEFGPFFGELSGKVVHDVCFINCDQIKAAAGRDAACHQNVMQQCGLNLGDVIAFQAHENASGKIWLSAPCWKCCSQDAQSLNQFISEWLAQQPMAVVTPQPSAVPRMLPGKSGATAPGFKTQVCKFFELGQCTKGEACTYAHGTEDLRGGRLAASLNAAAGSSGINEPPLKMLKPTVNLRA